MDLYKHVTHQHNDENDKFYSIYIINIVDKLINKIYICSKELKKKLKNMSNPKLLKFF